MCMTRNEVASSTHILKLHVFDLKENSSFLSLSTFYIIREIAQHLSKNSYRGSLLKSTPPYELDVVTKLFLNVLNYVATSNAL